MPDPDGQELEARKPGAGAKHTIAVLTPKWEVGHQATSRRDVTKAVGVVYQPELALPLCSSLSSLSSTLTTSTKASITRIYKSFERIITRTFNMTRGDKPATRVHYKGDHNDFVIFAESPEIVCRWKRDRSIPLMEVVDSFHVFTTYAPFSPPSPQYPPNITTQVEDKGLTIRGVSTDNSRHQGAQGHLEEASRLALDNEFGTHQDEDVVKKILECGEVKETKERERTGNTVCFFFLFKLTSRVVV